MVGPLSTFAALYVMALFAAAPAVASVSPHTEKDVSEMRPLEPMGKLQALLPKSALIASIALDDMAPTAVYDITARVVVMPDGTRLEAHSGLGMKADNPRFVRERMRGPTPPALYDLIPLATLFHGVFALRLHPISGHLFGRTDLLAHTYMLHGRPESFGCVVFRDYASFLRAFRLGRVQRLRVVPASGDAALSIASRRVTAGSPSQDAVETPAS